MLGDLSYIFLFCRYDGIGTMNTLPMQIFTTFPGMHNIVTNK